MSIYLTAGISGAHLNPAVSIALTLFAGFERRKLPFYILAQVCGAFCGAALVYTLYSSLFFDFEQAHTLLRGSESSLELAAVFSTYPHPPCPRRKRCWLRWSSRRSSWPSSWP